MTIRINDSFKPGYERIGLGDVGKTQPPSGANKIGSPILNQAQAAVLGQASIATPPTYGITAAVVTAGLIANVCVGDLNTTHTAIRNLAGGSPWILTGFGASDIHTSTGPGDPSYAVVPTRVGTHIAAPDAYSMTGKTVAMWLWLAGFPPGASIFCGGGLEIVGGGGWWGAPSFATHFGNESRMWAAAPPYGSWFHCCAVQGRNVLLINGAHNMSANGTGGWSIPGVPTVRVGDDSYGAMVGLRYSKIRIWNRQLSDAEIAQEYAQGAY